MPRVFLITGCSTGFGREYAQEVINKGDCCVATARNPSQLNFKGTNDKNYLSIALDVTDQKSITDAFDAALKKFGRVDVVCNNAGYGLMGNFEDYTHDQIRQQMEINFFGLIDVTRTALETMREKNKPSGGLIQQVTSIGGQTGVPLYSIYCASKWAVEGFTEAVSKEINPEWGIKLQCIEPGGFRTDWAGRSMTVADRHPAYTHNDPATTRESRHGKQPGDPAKAATAMYKLAVMDDPPLRMCLGSDANKGMMGKIDAYKELYTKFADLSKSTDGDFED